ncbi:Rieske 2Fe-2S domain-containing protein [Actinacidiphila acididurans]|uniref:Rieske 2Fe-2S domain-containing protein n=1 Tax=Actinacidiphila acididurans TaxID=2784346 RepID=A0ABS2U7E0_9ACTN|nr:Rieske 2Fe-2S domain-containing protein [Actinacidiphila acididurans]MBM9510083.1 Rieske 2Fe-2S domain-containing protein [Actinacidiphila acididurans]
MLVVTFSATGAGNCVEVAGTPYVYARTRRDGSDGFVMGARCPHRGGPLHLASVSEDGARLVCPWHGGRVSLARLRRQVPAVRRGDTVTAVFAVPADTEATVRHVPVSDALCAAPPVRVRGLPEPADTAAAPKAAAGTAG